MEDKVEPGIRNTGIERRNMQVLGIGCILSVIIGLLGLKVLAAVTYHIMTRFHSACKD